MIDCESVRDRFEDEPSDPALQAHLEQCAACRLEAAFSRQIAAAVASMPRLAAPDGLAGSIMAALQAARGESRTPRRPSYLALRWWELGGIAACCLALLAFLFHVWDAWAEPWQRLSPWPAVSDLVGLPRRTGDALASQPLRDWTSPFQGLWQSVGPYAVWEPDRLLPWLCGAGVFALALYALLSWGRGNTGGPSLEDAHA